MQSAAMDAGVQVQQAVADEPEVRKGPWTMQEDHVLINYIAGHHAGAWNNLARAAGLNRTGKSCRVRWVNYLHPGVRRGNMTAEEEECIVDLQDRWGNKWSRIAKHLLPGRTDNEVKNFWRTKIQHKHKRRNNKDGYGAIETVVTVADICSGSMAAGWNNTLAVTEDQGCSNYSGQTETTGVTQDYGIVMQQPNIPIVADHLAGYEVLGVGGAGGAGATELIPDFLAAASGENFWAVDDFWTMMQSYSYQGSSS
ncbi:unnamed protein product [Urochloa humidicola]